VSWRAGTALLALGLLAAVLPGCAPSHSPTMQHYMMLEPARAAEAAGDYQKALREYARPAEGGVPVAQYQLGRMYDKGLGTAKNPAEAARWYRAAADNGYPRAQLALARMSEYGRGIPKDEVAALALYRAVAEYELSAEYRLKAPRMPGVANVKAGQMIEQGRGTAADPAEAARYYQHAADAGNADGQYLLAELYWNGKGVAQDPAAAEDLYLAAAANYLAPAAAGNGNAQNRLGNLYFYGRGVIKDVRRGIALLEQAAANGNGSAQARLARVFEDGGGGVPADGARAVHYYEQAIASGYDYVRYRLAAMYANGKGVPKDSHLALELFAEAAWHGNGSGAYKVAEAFERGVGVEPSPLEALSWYQIADSLGEKRAAEHVARLQARLGPAQTQEAVAVAAAWQRERSAPETLSASFAGDESDAEDNSAAADE
jgi:TPR repeat protein